MFTNTLNTQSSAHLKNFPDTFVCKYLQRLLLGNILLTDELNELLLAIAYCKEIGTTQMAVSKTYRVRLQDLIVIQYLLYLEFGVVNKIRIVSQTCEFVDNIELSTFSNIDAQTQKCYKFFECVARQLKNPDKIYETYGIEKDSGSSQLYASAFSKSSSLNINVDALPPEMGDQSLSFKESNVSIPRDDDEGLMSSRQTTLSRS